MLLRVFLTLIAISRALGAEPNVRCFNVPQGGRLSYYNDVLLVDNHPPHLTHEVGHYEAHNVTKQIVYVSCRRCDPKGHPEGQALCTYDPYLESSLLSVAGLLDGPTEVRTLVDCQRPRLSLCSGNNQGFVVCLLTAGHKGELLRPHVGVANHQWRYTGDLLPDAKARQWIVDWSCSNTEFYKEITKLKTDLIEADLAKE
eukprot:7216327-Pyramimonas_sp.AAC.1